MTAKTQTMNVAVFQQSLMDGRRNLNFVEFTLVIKYFLLFPAPAPFAVL